MRLLWQLSGIVALALLFAWCATGKSGDSQDASDHSLRDRAVVPPDAAPDGSPDAAPDSTSPSPDADAAQPSSDAAGSPLNPNLEVPPAGTVCFTPGSSSECGYLEVCRFYDSLYGRCETCSTCGNLGAFCTASNQCDILFTCYLNECTNICPLGTTYCGPIPDCLDIGHPTHGVCAP